MNENWMCSFLNDSEIEGFLHTNKNLFICELNNNEEIYVCYYFA